MCNIEEHSIQYPRVVVADVQQLRLTLLASFVVELEVVRLLHITHCASTTILNTRLALKIFQVLSIAVIGACLGVVELEGAVHLWLILDRLLGVNLHDWQTRNHQNVRALLGCRCAVGVESQC